MLMLVSITAEMNSPIALTLLSTVEGQVFVFLNTATELLVLQICTPLFTPSTTL